MSGAFGGFVFGGSGGTPTSGMTLLALARRTAVECGVASNTAIETALPTIIGATGSLGRIVNWVRDAWSDIQMDRNDWDWMRSSRILGQGVSFATISGQTRYPLGTGVGTVGIAEDAFGAWDCCTFRCETTSIGFRDEMVMEEIPFDAWRNSYMLGAMRSVATRPYVVAVGPDQSLNLGPPPNSNYTITADYFMGPQDLILDTDVPSGLPARFHMLICYRAMMKYAGFESAPEVYERGLRESTSTTAQLMVARAPRVTWGGALA